MNVGDDLRSSARRRRGERALIYRGREMSYEELDAQVDRVASGLRKLGIRKGDRVVFALESSPSLLSLYYACLRAGAVGVALPTSLKADDFRDPIAKAAPRAIVGDEGVVGEILSAGPHSAPVYVTGRHPTARPFEEILSEAAPQPAETETGDAALIVRTSGVRGGPPEVVLTHGSIAAAADQAISALSLEQTDLVSCPLPLHQVPGLNVAGAAIRRGAGLSMGAPAGEVTVVVATPPGYAELLESGTRLPRLRSAVSVGAPLPPAVGKDFRERHGVGVREAYALDEASGIVAAATGSSPQRSVGRPLGDAAIRIVDALGNDVVRGDPGEIWLRGPSIFSGYYQDEGATGESFAGDWLRTGDAAYQDEDANLFLAGRIADVIGVSGFRVYPSEVETALVSHPLIADAGVVGAPDERQGERVKAYVVFEQGEVVGEDQLIVYCTTRLARFKVPTEIQAIAEIPRDAAGRVRRERLA